MEEVEESIATAESVDDISFSAALQRYLGEHGIDDKLYDFLERKCTGIEVPEDDSVEQPLQLYQAYKDFTQLFEEEFEEFMQLMSINDLNEMYEKLQEENNADLQASKFFDRLLASLEYTSFCKLVKDFNAAPDNDEEGDEENDEEFNDDEEGDADSEGGGKAVQS